MTKSWQKFVHKLSSKQKSKIDQAIDQIKNKDVEGLDFKKMTGQKELYRCRIGMIRLIFRKNKDQNFEIIHIGNRGNIYKKQ